MNGTIQHSSEFTGIHTKKNHQENEHDHDMGHGFGYHDICHPVFLSKKFLQHKLRRGACGPLRFFGLAARRCLGCGALCLEGSSRQCLGDCVDSGHLSTRTGVESGVMWIVLLMEEMRLTSSYGKYPMIYRVLKFQVVQDFVHQQYQWIKISKGKV